MIKYKIKKESNNIFNIDTISYSEGRRYNLNCNIEYDHGHQLFDVKYYFKGIFLLRYHFDAIDRKNDPIIVYENVDIRLMKYDYLGEVYCYIEDTMNAFIKNILLKVNFII